MPNFLQRFQHGNIRTGLFDDIVAEADSICNNTLATHEMTWEEQLFLDKWQKHLVENGIIDRNLREKMAAIGRLDARGEIKVIHD